MSQRGPESTRDAEVDNISNLPVRTIEQRLGRFSDLVKEAFEGWSALYGKTPVERERLLDIVSDVVKHYGDQRVWMFYVTGIYWKDLSFHEFQLVMHTLIQEKYKLRDLQPGDVVDEVLARGSAETAAMDLMRIFLWTKSVDKNAERARYIRQLLVKEGSDFVRTFCAVTEGHPIQYELYQGVEELLRLRQEKLARAYLVAYERWGCTPLEAVTLVARVVFIYQEKGVEACSVYLNAPTQPVAPQTFH